MKQDDPHSPNFFILKTEDFSRAFNALFNDNLYKSYKLSKWNRNLNHLAYVDDTIIFTSRDETSSELVMKL